MGSPCPTDAVYLAGKATRARCACRMTLGTNSVASVPVQAVRTADTPLVAFSLRPATRGVPGPFPETKTTRFAMRLIRVAAFQRSAFNLETP